MSVLLSDPIRLQKIYISGWPSHCLTNTHQNWDAFGDGPFCSLSSKCTVQKDGRLVKGPSTSASSRRLSSSLSLICHPPCQPAVAPIPQKKQKRIQWNNHKEAHDYLKSKLAEFQALRKKERKIWLPPVQEHVVSTWIFDYSAGDVRKVCSCLLRKVSFYINTLSGCCYMVQKSSQR